MPNGSTLPIPIPLEPSLVAAVRQAGWEVAVGPRGATAEWVLVHRGARTDRRRQRVGGLKRRLWPTA